MIADREGVNPIELSPPLHSAVDPDALDSLFSNRTSQERRTVGAVSFEYCGYEVVVKSDGDVTIAEIDEES